MAGLKTFLGRLSPLLGVTPAALYERQRVLVDIGLIKTRGGRGPGSGVPFTAENVAALVISILATDSLSEIDERVVDLCNARHEAVPGSTSYSMWVHRGEPPFLTEVAGVLSGQTFGRKGRHCYGIRVTRMWRGQLIHRPIRHESTFLASKTARSVLPVSLTAAIEENALDRLIAFVTHTEAALKASQDQEEPE
jgi:hypothetical protein